MKRFASCYVIHISTLSYTGVHQTLVLGYIMNLNDRPTFIEHTFYRMRCYCKSGLLNKTSEYKAYTSCSLQLHTYRLTPVRPTIHCQVMTFLLADEAARDLRSCKAWHLSFITKQAVREAATMPLPLQVDL